MQGLLMDAWCFHARLCVLKILIFLKLCMKTEKKPYQCFFFHFKEKFLYQVLFCILIVNYIYIGFVVYIFFLYDTIIF